MEERKHFRQQPLEEVKLAFAAQCVEGTARKLGVPCELSRRLGIPPAQALDLFYRSKTCAQLHDKRTGLYLMSNAYIADDFVRER